MGKTPGKKPQKRKLSYDVKNDIRLTRELLNNRRLVRDMISQLKPMQSNTDARLAISRGEMIDLTHRAAVKQGIDFIKRKIYSNPKNKPEPNAKRGRYRK